MKDDTKANTARTGYPFQRSNKLKVSSGHTMMPSSSKNHTKVEIIILELHSILFFASTILRKRPEIVKQFRAKKVMPSSNRPAAASEKPRLDLVMAE